MIVVFVEMTLLGPQALWAARHLDLAPTPQDDVLFPDGSAGTVASVSMIDAASDRLYAEVVMRKEEELIEQKLVLSLLRRVKIPWPAKTEWIDLRDQRLEPLTE